MKFIKKLFLAIFGLAKALIAITIGIVAVAMIFPEYITFGTPSRHLTEFSPKPIIDMHVHVAGFGYGGSGCFINPTLSQGYKSYFYLRAFGVSETELKTHGDQVLVEKLSNRIAESSYTAKAVILALDGVFDKQGVMKRKRTQVYVPNSFVKEQADKYDNLLYGASINPYRKDAIEQLRKAKEDGAVLIKWIPNIMHIDPADTKLIPFYKEMIALNMPLLTHAGQERSFSSSIDEYGDPVRLKLPLVLGVKVIAAHVATTGQVDGQEMIDRLLPFFEKYSNLYTDISSLTQINKLNYLDKGLLNTDLSKRMLYGSDWPLQFFPLVTPWTHVLRLRLADIQYIASRDNVFDRDLLLKHALGVPLEVFEQNESILGISAKASKELDPVAIFDSVEPMQ